MIELRNVKKTFDGQRYILNNMNLKIRKGEYVQIAGKSGSGKSTLLNLIGLLDCNYEGDLFINEHNVSRLTDIEISKLRSEFIGFIFQSYNLINHMSVLENISMPMLYSARKYNEEFRSRIKNLMKQLAIETISDLPVQFLSGGEKQRVAIARALSLDPSIILADEPTGNLDVSNSEIIFETLKFLSKNGKSIILVTHDVSKNWGADRLLTLKEGTLI